MGRRRRSGLWPARRGRTGRSGQRAPRGETQEGGPWPVWEKIQLHASLDSPRTLHLLDEQNLRPSSIVLDRKTEVFGVPNRAKLGGKTTALLSV